MLEMGARFTDSLYISTAFDPDNEDCTVKVITVNECEEVIKTGEVIWDE